METNMSKPVILTGLRANNDLHIGNYLGALLPLVDMAHKKAGEYQINLFVPDLHSFTTPIDHDKLQDAIMQNLRVFAAAGLPLDNPNVYIYRQSYIPAHSELTWILDCFTGMGEMSRMTQFKDKSQGFHKKTQIITRISEISKKIGFKDIAYGTDNETGYQVNSEVEPTESEAAELADLFNQIFRLDTSNAVEPTVGLFNYPVLMAADMLLYNAKYVPVGDDQTQHLEFTRDIAERMNKKFNAELFIIPEPVAKQHEFFGKDQGLRIRDLQNPTKKMSKSDDSGKGVIFLTDSPEEACKKIMSAETDSKGSVQYDYDLQPGVSNLLDIYKLLGGEPREFMSESQYGLLKKAVADKVEHFLKEFQSKLQAVDDAQLLQKLEADEAAMRKIADTRLHQVQQAVGLRL
jgi:tryptophanyl-tRNA synthetase